MFRNCFFVVVLAAVFCCGGVSGEVPAMVHAHAASLAAELRAREIPCTVHLISLDEKGPIRCEELAGSDVGAGGRKRLRVVYLDSNIAHVERLAEIKRQLSDIGIQDLTTNGNVRSEYVMFFRYTCVGLPQAIEQLDTILEGPQYFASLRNVTSEMVCSDDLESIERCCPVKTPSPTHKSGSLFLLGAGGVSANNSASPSLVGLPLTPGGSRSKVAQPAPTVEAAGNQASSPFVPIVQTSGVVASPARSGQNVIPVQESVVMPVPEQESVQIAVAVGAARGAFTRVLGIVDGPASAPLVRKARDGDEETGQRPAKPGGRAPGTGDGGAVEAAGSGGGGAAVLNAFSPRDHHVRAREEIQGKIGKLQEVLKGRLRELVHKAFLEQAVVRDAIILYVSNIQFVTPYEVKVVLHDPEKYFSNVSRGRRFLIVCHLDSQMFDETSIKDSFRANGDVGFLNVSNGSVVKNLVLLQEQFLALLATALEEDDEITSALEGLRASLRDGHPGYFSDDIIVSPSAVPRREGTLVSAAAAAGAGCGAAGPEASHHAAGEVSTNSGLRRPMPACMARNGAPEVFKCGFEQLVLGRRGLKVYLDEIVGVERGLDCFLDSLQEATPIHVVVRLSRFTEIPSERLLDYFTKDGFLLPKLDEKHAFIFILNDVGPLMEGVGTALESSLRKQKCQKNAWSEPGAKAKVFLWRQPKKTYEGSASRVYNGWLDKNFPGITISGLPAVAARGAADS